MKGLLIKDIRLMANMSNNLFLIILIAVGMSTYLNDTSFLVVYLGLMGTTFTTSTLSYDEFDNGYAFLFSLPVSRKGYVIEKYSFGLIMCGGGWLLGSILTVVSGMIRGTGEPRDLILESLLLLPMAFAVLAILLPFHMKFGAEKGRIVMVAVMGGLFIAFILAVKVLGRMNLNLDLDAMLESMPVLGMGAAAVVAVAIGVALLLLSCRISLSIMEKKEF